MFRTVDHPADVAVEIESPSLEELFSEGMMALRAIAVMVRDEKVEDKIEVEVQGVDIEDLFVRWLNEGIYLIYVKRLLPMKVFDVKIEGFKVMSSIGVKKFVPHKDRFLIELKAATYHGLKLEKRDNGYYITVVFDI